MLNVSGPPQKEDTFPHEQIHSLKNAPRWQDSETMDSQAGQEP